MNHRFTVLESKDAARALMIELEKYHEHLTDPLSMLALALDPAVPRTDEKVISLMTRLREILRQQYDIKVTCEHAYSFILKKSTQSMLIAALKAQALMFEFNNERDDIFNKIMDFLHFTKMGDESCHDVVV